MPKYKQISIQEYVDKVSPLSFRKNRKNVYAPVTQQAIKWRIKKGYELPGVITYVQIGRRGQHLLTVKEDF